MPDKTAEEITDETNHKALDSAVSQGEAIARFFSYSHLKPELAFMSRKFAELALTVMMSSPRNAERTVALRKLLEGKDCAVRACLPVNP